MFKPYIASYDSFMHEQSSTICDSFSTKPLLVSLKLDGISKYLHISLSILNLKNESVFKFFSHNLRQSQTQPQRRSIYISPSTILQSWRFRKLKVNVNLLKSSNFSHFALVFLPKGPSSIIQNPNNPDRHKCHYRIDCWLLLSWW